LHREGKKNLIKGSKGEEKLTSYVGVRSGTGKQKGGLKLYIKVFECDRAASSKGLTYPEFSH